MRRERGWLVDLTFPYDDHSPAPGLQFAFDLLVPRDIAFKLVLPELWAGLRCVTEPAIMPMPEAAMDENSNSSRTKYNIRASTKIATVEPKAISHPMKEAPHSYFRSRVSPTNSGHKGATLFWTHYIIGLIRSFLTPVTATRGFTTIGFLGSLTCAMLTPCIHTSFHLPLPAFNSQPTTS